jgi:Uma2 family endonuclease
MLGMSAAPRQLHCFRRDEYQRMGELGFFQNQRVELIAGEIVDMAPQKDVHAVAVMLVQQALLRAFPECVVRCQLPLTLADDSEPEPDLAVVPGKPRDYLGLGHHPTSALLVIEISESTLAFDRSTKAALYARAGIADYWIVNLIDRQVEVFRHPVADSASSVGYSYAQTTAYTLGQQIQPLATAASSIAVADLLP